MTSATDKVVSKFAITSAAIAALSQSSFARPGFVDKLSTDWSTPYSYNDGTATTTFATSKLTLGLYDSGQYGGGSIDDFSVPSTNANFTAVQQKLGPLLTYQNIYASQRGGVASAAYSAGIGGTGGIWTMDASYTNKVNRMYAISNSATSVLTLYNAGGLTGNSGDNIVNAANNNDFANLALKALATATTAGHPIKALQVWNEMAGYQQTVGATGDLNTSGTNGYFAMYKAVVTAVRMAYPSVKIIGPYMPAAGTGGIAGAAPYTLTPSGAVAPWAGMSMSGTTIAQNPALNALDVDTQKRDLALKDFVTKAYQQGVTPDYWSTDRVNTAFNDKKHFYGDQYDTAHGIDPGNTTQNPNGYYTNDQTMKLTENWGVAINNFQRIISQTLTGLGDTTHTTTDKVPVWMAEYYGSFKFNPSGNTTIGYNDTTDTEQFEAAQYAAIYKQLVEHGVSTAMLYNGGYSAIETPSKLYSQVTTAGATPTFTDHFRVFEAVATYFSANTNGTGAKMMANSSNSPYTMDVLSSDTYAMLINKNSTVRSVNFNGWVRSMNPYEVRLVHNAGNDTFNSSGSVTSGNVGTVLSKWSTTNVVGSSFIAVTPTNPYASGNALHMQNPGAANESMNAVALVPKTETLANGNTYNHDAYFESFAVKTPTTGTGQWNFAMRGVDGSGTILTGYQLLFRGGGSPHLEISGATAADAQTGTILQYSLAQIQSQDTSLASFSFGDWNQYGIDLLYPTPTTPEVFLTIDGIQFALASGITQTNLTSVVNWKATFSTFNTDPIVDSYSFLSSRTLTSDQMGYGFAALTAVPEPASIASAAMLGLTCILPRRFRRRAA